MISSQRYIDETIVAEKLEARDFAVTVAFLSHPDFPGEEFTLLVDGHHSLAAAKQAGVAPEITHVDHLQAELDALGLEDFLTVYSMGDDWYDVETGVDVW